MSNILCSECLDTQYTVDTRGNIFPCSICNIPVVRKDLCIYCVGMQFLWERGDRKTYKIPCPACQPKGIIGLITYLTKHVAKIYGQKINGNK